jgi:hypothetical protein
MPKIWQMFLYEDAYCQVEQAGFAGGDGRDYFHADFSASAIIR